MRIVRPDPEPQPAAVRRINEIHEVHLLLQEMAIVARNAGDQEALAAVQAAGDAVQLATSRILQILTPHLGCNRCEGRLYVRDEMRRTRFCEGTLRLGEEDEATTLTECCS